MKRLFFSICLSCYPVMALTDPVWQFLSNADGFDVYVDTTSRQQNSALFKFENDPESLTYGFDMAISRFSANCESKLIWLDSGRKYLNGRFVGTEMVEKIDIMDISSDPESSSFKRMFNYICQNQ
jgi:hypothetical protein